MERDPVLRPQESAQYLGISKASLYRLERSGKLARHLVLGPTVSGWRLSDLNAYLDALPRAGAGDAVA